MAVSSDSIGKEICDIFGIKNCYLLDIHFAVNSLVSVTAKFCPEEDQIRQLIPILKRYRLKEIDKEENSMLIFGEKGNEV